MLLIAAVAAISTLAWRTRNQDDLNLVLLFFMLPTALLSGWIVSGIVMALKDTLSAQSILENLSPLTRSGHTITFFGAGACVAIVVFLIPQGRAAFTYLDVLAPSFPAGLAFAKLGCFLAGCCAGTICEYPIAVTYPFGSDAYTAQWQAGMLTPPPELIRDTSDHSQRLLGHAQSLQIARNTPSSRSAEHAHEHGVSFPELVDTASNTRSLGVWPTQLGYVLFAVLLWGVSEYLFRKTQFPGATIGLVLAGYGVMRIAFDFFVEGLEPILFQLTLPQWSGVLALTMACVICATGWRLRTTRRNSSSNPTAPSP